MNTNILFLIAILIVIVTSKKYDINIIKYLQTYGYLDNNIRSSDNVYQAILKFQNRFNLNPTGELDSETLQLINTPRCGFKDVFTNGELDLRYTLSSHKWSNQSFTYRIVNRPKYFSFQNISYALSESFKKWSESTELNFYQILNSDQKDPVIDISFREKNYFEKNVLAVAYLPKYGGNIYFKNLPNWYFSGLKKHKSLPLIQTAIHEIGHSLGLLHSSNRYSIMFPYINYNQEKLELHNDDIQGIQALYKPRRCKNSKIDAIFSPDEDTVFIFYGVNFWTLRFKNYGFKRIHFNHTAQNIVEKWHGLSTNIDAAFYLNHSTYFLKNSQVWKFDGFQLDRNYPKNISAIFYGVPNEIDSVLVLENNIFFFKGVQFWKIDLNQGFNVTEESPQKISFFGLSHSIDASIFLHNFIYFFKNNVYYKGVKFDTEYPRSTGHYWFGCQSLTKKRVNVNFKNLQ